MPGNAGLLDPYLDHLQKLSRRRFGLMSASLPGYDTPMFFRGGTSDVHNMRQIFRHHEYGFDFNSAPQTILDLGAYCGYAAIFLSRRFPNAQILCVEPSIANFKILTLNTAPYQNIKCVHGAVWNELAELNLVDRLGGHWGSIFRIAQDESTVSLSETTQAYTVNELLTMASWPRVDYVKCDIEGAELEVFSDPAAAGWLANVHCISVETHDRFRPGCTDAVETALPESHYDRLQSGEFRVFLARDPAPCHSCDDASSVEVVVLSPGTLKTRTFDLVNVPPHSWGFEVVDEETFQLHPNVPGQPPAEIRFQIDLNGQSRFTAMCQLAAEARDQVSFGVRLVGGGRTAIAETITVTPGEKAQFEVAIPRRKAAYN